MPRLHRADRTTTGETMTIFGHITILRARTNRELAWRCEGFSLKRGLRWTGLAIGPIVIIYTPWSVKRG